MFLYKYHKNSLESIKTDVKIGIFPIPIAYWSGFGMFKQNRENPDEIGMIGQSAIYLFPLYGYEFENDLKCNLGSKRTCFRSFF